MNKDAQPTGTPIAFARALDSVERLAIAGLYVFFLSNLAFDIFQRGHYLSLLLAASESAVLLFVLLRRPTADITRKPFDWLLGFAGTAAPLLVLPAAAPLIPPAAILVMMLCGAALQIAAKLFLRRSFGIVAANRGVKTTGPYRFIRHPMYAGYILTQLGFLLANPTAWNLAVYALAWSAQIGRILVEERLLLNDEAYRSMVERVPYRLVPYVF